MKLDASRIAALAVALATFHCGGHTAESGHDAGPPPPNHQSYGTSLGNLQRCSPTCSETEACANAAQPDVGCPPMGSGNCIPGCPGCPASPPSCVPLPACPAGLSCDCILQSLCGHGDASFLVTATTSDCEYVDGGWIVQCGNDE